MNRPMSSLDNVPSIPFKQAQLFVAFVLHGSTPRRWIEVDFQVTRPIFPPQKRSCVRSNGLWSAMNRPSTSPDIVRSTPLQLAQLIVSFISH